MNASATTDKPASKARQTGTAAEAGAASGAAAHPPKKPVIFNQGNFRPTEMQANRWMTWVPAGTEAEDLDLKPEPFACVAHLMNEGDDVRCLSADRLSIIDLVCVRKTGTMAVCRVTTVIKVPAIDAAQTAGLPPNHEIVESQPGDDQTGWLVRRISDNVVLNRYHEILDYEEARHFLLNHSSIRGNPAAQYVY